VTRPLDRNARLPAQGRIDSENGEVWAENAFQMPANGQNLSAYERNRLFLNVGGSAFVDASFAARADVDADSRAVVAADFDGDGAPDLLVGSVGGGPLRLFLNRFPTARRVRIELIGETGNRMAIGSRVTACAGDRQVVRDLFPVNGGAGQGPAEMLMGLGDATRLDELVVRWPDGKTQTFTDLPVDATLRIRQGQPAVTVSSLRRAVEETP